MNYAGILIIDPLHEVCIDGLREMGFAVDYVPDIGIDSLKEALQKGRYEGLIVRTKCRVDAGLLDGVGDLVFVGRAGAGLDNIAVEVLKERGIRVLHAAEANAETVAEHTIGMLLCLLHHVCRADADVRQKRWRREAFIAEELFGQVVGVMGYGHMGRQVVKKLRGMGVEVMVYDTNKEVEVKEGRRVEIEEIWAHATVLSVHIPLLEANRRIINGSFLSQFKHPIWILNTSRGGIMDYHALWRALEEGRVKGAGLDVFSHEPLEKMNKTDEKLFEALCAHSQVLFTPHIAGWGRGSFKKIGEVLLEKIKRLYFRS